MIIILQNFDVLPLSINAVPMNELDAIQEWLTDCSITYTAGQASMSWKSVMNLVKGDPRFYEETDEHGESKLAGCSFRPMTIMTGMKRKMMAMKIIVLATMMMRMRMTRTRTRTRRKMTKMLTEMMMRMMMLWTR